MNFFDAFKHLCDERNISPNAVGKKIGFSSGSITSWKKGTLPKFEARLKIADFFQVPVTVFLTEKERKDFGIKHDNTNLFLGIPDDSASIDLAKMLQSAPGLMFNGAPLSDNDREKVLKAIKFAMDLSDKK